MKKNVYSIKDIKSCYGHPHLADSSPAAIRQFQVAIQSDPKGMYNSHASDFLLCHIGTFDLETSQLTPLESPIILCSAADLLQPQTQQ